MYRFRSGLDLLYFPLRHLAGEYIILNDEEICIFLHTNTMLSAMVFASWLAHVLPVTSARYSPDLRNRFFCLSWINSTLECILWKHCNNCIVSYVYVCGHAKDTIKCWKIRYFMNEIEDICSIFLVISFLSKQGYVEMFIELFI